jgi:hypothetical protein
MENNAEQVAHLVCKYLIRGMKNAEHCVESLKKCRGEVREFNIAKITGSLSAINIQFRWTASDRVEELSYRLPTV